MFDVTTRYDNVNGERRKVFIIRGDEAYAKTVDVVLSYTRGTHTNDTIAGFPVTLNAKLYRNVGDSVLVFYDGEEPIDTIATHDWQSQYTLPVRLSWGDTHKITAQYKSNTQSLGKKSKSITLHETIPSSYVPTITFTSSNQINQSTSYTVTGRVQFMGENVIDGTEIVISLDGEVINTVETTNGIFSCPLGTIGKGTHTVTAETIQSDTMNAKAQSLTLNSGYEITILKYPSTLITDVPSEFKIAVKTNEGNPVSNVTVNFNGTNYTTNSQGIATFNLSTITTGDFRASCNGSYSDYVHIESVTLPDIYVTSDERILAQNETLPIDINVPNGSGMKVKVYEDNSPITDLTLDKNGSATYNYNGANNGEVEIKFATTNLTKTVNILDTVCYYSQDEGSRNLRVMNFKTLNFRSSSTKNLELTFLGTGAGVHFDPIYGDYGGNVMELTIPSLNQDQLHFFDIRYGGRNVAKCENNEWRGKTVKLVYDDGKCYQYVDGALNKTYNNISAPSEPLRWTISLGQTLPSSNTSKMEISDLKIYKE